MIGGRGFDLAPFTTVETSELFLALGASEPGLSAGSKRDLQVTIASRIECQWVEFHFHDAISTRTQVVYNSELEAVQKQTSLSFHDLALETPQISRPSDDEAFAILLDACLERWESQFTNAANTSRDDLKRLYERWNFVGRSTPELPPLDDFRHVALEEACFGETKLDSVMSKPLAEIMLRHLPRELARTLEDVAPEFFQVPSGSRIRIHYPDGREPFLEVRIQEIFGLKATPRLGPSRIPIVFHLLGPNFRPVQVTSDLESFWKAGYAEVRKELRARYPKHSWPENPLDAKPEAKGGRRQS
jgi:ATP-dependent helicase HrpB